jgi:hypothetical protein
MFIGWIRKKSFESDLDTLSKTLTLDKSLIMKTFEENHALCFGAYDENKLVAFISASEMEESILINNFYYTDDFSNDGKKRVIKLLMNNIGESDKPLLFMSRKEEKDTMLSFGFKEYTKFKKAVYSGGGVAFNFTNATAKSISNENYLSVLTNIEKRAYKQNRAEYIKNNLIKSSSLVLSTQFGYQHSYAIGKSLIKISPWTMEDAAYSDAEKMMRRLIYHRGLKKIFAFVPSDVKEITDLYSSYKFEFVEEFSLLYLNSEPSIELDMVYAF